MLRFAVHAQVERRPEGNMDTGNLGGERDPCGDCGCNRSGDHAGTTAAITLATTAVTTAATFQKMCMIPKM